VDSLHSDRVVREALQCSETCRVHNRPLDSHARVR
jgi:hypothetical protein